MNAHTSLKDAMVHGLASGLPVSLLLTYCFTPSVSASIFRAWHCVSFTYSELEELSFLAEDFRVRCDGSHEHAAVLAVAWPMVAIWPIGSVVMYALLLVPCRKRLYDEDATSPLIRATSFLHRDFKPP